MRSAAISAGWYRISVLIVAMIIWIAGCSETKRGEAPVTTSLEDILPNGSLYTPSTQSFLRGGHWMESIESVEILTDEGNLARIRLKTTASDHFMEVVNLPLEQLVPRLHYQPAGPPDEFDAYNLMLAEYSRNSMSVPVGAEGDEMAHFETNLDEVVPWELAADFKFIPKEHVRPIRVGVINNCLRPGLWELNASDGSGEIYHSWFDMPPDLYLDLLATANGIDREFAEQATVWSTDPVELRLDRLRSVLEKIGKTPLSLCADVGTGYSSQDSRRKLDKGYVLVEKDGALGKPDQISELTRSICYLSDFVEPGKYSFTDRRSFDLSFLAAVDHVEINRVEPLTDYDWRNKTADKPNSATGYIEMTLHLDSVSIILGNLPLDLLVPQEDFSLNGFGVGILSSSGIAERRRYLINEGPAPSFAYLIQGKEGRLQGLNSHDFGIEQVFIRTHSNSVDPWWEITITSFERMVDLVRYRVDIPAELTDELKTCAMQYISPLYRTYRDDNLR